MDSVAQAATYRGNPGAIGPRNVNERRHIGPLRGSGRSRGQR